MLILLVLDGARPSCDLPNISRWFALGASHVCLVGQTRGAPSRHGMDAGVYGQTTTAMHDNELTPTFHKECSYIFLRIGMHAVVISCSPLQCIALVSFRYRIRLL